MPGMNNADIADLMRQRGGLAYEGEGVTQLQHSWQCGQLALQAGASATLRLAAWLHDLGHLLSPLPGTPTLAQLNDNHETTGGDFLSTQFGPAVGMPVRLHVQAKRYLVAVHPVYRERLSADSVRSLALQGGPFSEDQAMNFRKRPWADDALRLRTWDDVGKLAHWLPPSSEAALAELADLMEQVRPHSKLPAAPGGATPELFSAADAGKPNTLPQARVKLKA